MTAPTLETPRLRLRPLEPADAGAVHRVWTDPEVRRYLFDGEVVSRELVDAEIVASGANFAEHGYGLWAVTLAEGGEIVGFCGYHVFSNGPGPQLLYGLAPAHWGRGLATEAARAAIRYGFETLGLAEVVGSTDAPNAASARVMERCGMRLRRRATVDGLDTLFYAITRPEWEAAGG